VLVEGIADAVGGGVAAGGVEAGVASFVCLVPGDVIEAEIVRPIAGDFAVAGQIAQGSFADIVSPIYVVFLPAIRIIHNIPFSFGTTGCGVEVSSSGYPSQHHLKSRKPPSSRSIE